MEIVDLIFGCVGKLPEWLWFVIVGGPLLAMFLFHLSLGPRRSAQWKRIALLLGFEYNGGDNSMVRALKPVGSHIAVDGFETRVLEVLSNEERGVQRWLLDHAGSKPRTLCTVCVMRSSGLHLPYFRLLSGSSVRLPKEQVVFQEDQEFSRIFMLITDDPAAIKRLFDPLVRRHFVRLFYRCRELERANTDRLDLLMLRVSNAIGRFEVEASGDTVSVRLSRLINPQGAPEFLALTEETLQILKGKQGEMG
ncbi:MAG: hypothetical protein EPN25_06935 [Nitrospirae bacterium]|nr:MAG: hypothetical protein EPN25_06935 [Nitrospirota bacterium]